MANLKKIRDHRVVGETKQVSASPTWVKTPKGIEEVERKTQGLALKSRQILIMIDGKRDMAALQGIFPPDMVAPILDELITGGFIRMLEPPAPATPPPVEKPAPRQGPPVASNDYERYQMARNFMLNTASAFLGIAGSSLSSKIEMAMDLDALGALYSDWHNAIALTPDGKKRLPELDQQILKLLGDLPVSPPPSAAPVAAPKAPPAAKEPVQKRPADDDERFLMARNFMVNTTNTFIGMAGSSLVDRLEAAENIAALRQLYFDWKAAMQLSAEPVQWMLSEQGVSAIARKRVQAQTGS